MISESSHCPLSQEPIGRNTFICYWIKFCWVLQWAKFLMWLFIQF